MRHAEDLLPPISMIGVRGSVAVLAIVACACGTGAGAPPPDAADAALVPVCTPGETAVCYSGPPATRGVGACREGVSVCSSDGLAWQPCAGEVTPSFAACGQPLDLDCNAEPDCPIAWSKLYGDAKDQFGTAIEPFPEGRLAVGGDFDGVLDFGSGPLTCGPDGIDLFLGVIGAEGQAAWSKDFGDQNTKEMLGAIDASPTSIAVGGFMEDYLDLGGGTMTAAGGSAGFIGSFDHAGSVRWSRYFGEPKRFDDPDSIDIASDGRVLISGNSYPFTGYPSSPGAIDFGGGPVARNKDYGAYFAVYDDAGAYLAAHIFDSNAPAGSPETRWAGADDFFLAGTFADDMDLGGGPLPALGSYDVVLARVGTDASVAWSQRLGGPADDFATLLEVTPDGGFLVAGPTWGDADFGAGLVDAIGYKDGFVAHYDGSGNHIWSRRFGSRFGVMRLSALAVLPDGGVFLGGSFATTEEGGPATFGTYRLQSIGSYDLVVVRLGPDGAVRWAAQYGGPGEEYMTAMARTADGGLVLGGRTNMTLDFGLGPLTSAGGFDVFLAKLMAP